MKLNELIDYYSPKLSLINGNPEIMGISSDSKDIERGFLFFALPGEKKHGMEFAKEALNRGAVAIVSDQVPEGLPAVLFDDPYLALSKWSAYFFGLPSVKMCLAGITGTNGKTTVSNLIHRIMESDSAAGIIGTSGYRYLEEKGSFSMTTPRPYELHGLFKRMLSAGVEKVVMEVSSHSLELKRVSEISFSSAVFTNLTRDHLDFHKNMENYYASKLKLFSLMKDGAIRPVINTDDEYGRKICTDAPVECVSYGVEQPADYSAEIIKEDLEGSSFVLKTAGKERIMNIRLPGRFNVYNALAAAAWGIEGDYEMETVCRVIEESAPVPGRLEILKKEGVDNRYVIIDYAHTPDALENVLLSLRRLKPGRLVCVFGCGGDRDRTKRPLMGKIAGLLADTVYLTSDNPRSEEPINILIDIELGLRETKTPYIVIKDREEAIKAALEDSRPGDCILIAGKGDEDYQIIGEKRIPFSDRRVARKYL